MRIINKSTTNKINTIDTEISILQERISQLEYQLLLISSEKKSRNRILDKYTIEKDPIMTFCMPTYNGEKYIERALDSILMQDTTYNYKIWIIDDHSADHTVDIVKEYMKIYPQRIMLDVNKVNEKGLTAAPKIYNNVRTKYWMNFDQDDYWISTDKIERFINYFELHPECTLVSSNVLVKKSHVLSPVYIGKQRKVTFDLKSYLGELNILLQTSATMFRNVFSSEELQKINSCVGTNKHLCIVGDTFRNVFALTKGTGYFEDSIDSVYNWTENGYWSKKNLAQQNLENTEYFYESIDFFEDKDVKNLIKEAAKKNWRLTEENQRLLTNTENEILSNIKVKLDSME